MAKIKQFKLVSLDVFLELVDLLVQVRLGEEIGKHICQDWEKFHLLGLVIDQLHLLLLAADVSELPSYC